MSLSVAAKNSILDAILNDVSYFISPAYASLHTADPGLTGASEASGGSYARQVVSGAGVAASGEETNAAKVTFPAPAAVEYTHIGIWAHLTSTAAADFIWGGPLDTPITGNGTDSISFAIDAITLKL